ncbi:MAG TPA: DUF222 domain-containing protein, partial [Acidimicrobiia bacterium]|nr:DUF222 domain-containing protein [Acidimicrobiia bacterium]
MFDYTEGVVGLLPGEGPEDLVAEDARAFELTCRMLADGGTDDDRDLLPDLDSLAAGPFLLAVLSSVDREKLNGYDLVRMVQAVERMVSHCQAESMASVHELAYAAPGDADSPPERLEFPDEYAADELRPALSITRRAAENRLSVAFDLRERLPRVWNMLSKGVIDLSRARVIADGTAHLDRGEARRIVDVVAERAPRLTTGQLAAWIRRLCVENDPEKAKKRAEHAWSDRRLVIEPTTDGTADLFLFDIDIADAKAIGRRVNGHMISHRRDGDQRSH